MFYYTYDYCCGATFFRLFFVGFEQTHLNSFMIYAYYHGDNIEYWLSRSGLKLHRDFDFDVWLSRPQDQRLALHEVVIHSESDNQQIHQLIKHSALCMIFVPELINDHWFKQFDQTNVVFFLAGFLNHPSVDRSLLNRDQWYRLVLIELAKMPGFHTSYVNVADPSWPDSNQLLAMPIPPHHIIDELCEKFNCYPEVHVVEDSCQDLIPDSVPDRWGQILRHPLFAEFYNNVRDPSWPNLEELQQMEVPPDLVRQEILLSFQLPDQQNPNQRLDLVHDVLKASSTDQVLNQAQTELHYYFFWSTVDLYHRRPKLLDLLTPGQPHQGFDVLLGRKKKHRDLVYSMIDHDNNLVTYFSQGDPDNIACSNQFIWPESVLPRPTNPVTDTTDEIQVDGVIASLSQVIPTEIYNQTVYSLVCESQCDNGFSFFTEKIIKPMLARRIFLVVSGQHYLKNLRRLGFKTFEDIFDESYDEILRMEDRIKTVVNLVNYINQQNAQDLYNQAQTILDHNYDLVMNTDWQNTMCKAIKKHSDRVFDNK